ncbi:MAG: thymidine phosphorylase [Propionibacteriaceae bacterium]|jgi:thymidine phosphorylase|nr:thymidine phosphorylase [Propionibacteriaceae bacterium]
MAERFDAVDVIQTKRDRGVLSDAQIDWVIDAYTRGVVAEEQMSALLMAVFLNGLTRPELNRWTDAMIASGERLDYSHLSRPTADKHSTGGVGDKITLPLTPLVASFGVAVPQLSGRGLGHTGGTLDKLESIPGWRPSLSNEEMYAQMDEVGAVICAAGAGLAPADRKLYALRDVTATVACIPLIASSIMSKKIAEGTGCLVLDVKCGSGAFMSDLDSARDLATTMVGIGSDHKVRTVALITDMSTPLGLTIGNALEVRESLEVLAGGGPADVVELTLALGREMLDAAAARIDDEGIPGAGVAAGSPEASRRAGQLREADLPKALSNGQAMDTWARLISAQGGNPHADLAWATHTHEVFARENGYVTSMDALKVGVAAWRLGAGRARKEDAVQAGAGIVLHAKPGDAIQKGQKLMTLHTDTPERFERGLEALKGAWTIADTPTTRSPVVLEKISE